MIPAIELKAKWKVFFFQFYNIQIFPELNNKLKKRDLDCLNIKARQQAPQAEEPSWSCSRHTIHSRIDQIKSNRSVSFQNYHEQSTTCVSSNSTIQDNSASVSASVINTGFIESELFAFIHQWSLLEPQFSSDLGRKMSADVEAQASARRTRRFVVIFEEKDYKHCLALSRRLTCKDPSSKSQYRRFQLLQARFRSLLKHYAFQKKRTELQKTFSKVAVVLLMEVFWWMVLLWKI